MPVMKVTLLGVLANVAFHHLTMVVLGMGVYGAGLALSLTGMFLLVTMVAYTWVFRCVGDVCTHGCCLCVLTSIDASKNIWKFGSGVSGTCVPGGVVCVCQVKSIRQKSMEVRMHFEFVDWGRPGRGNVACGACSAYAGAVGTRRSCALPSPRNARFSCQGSRWCAVSLSVVKA